MQNFKLYSFYIYLQPQRQYNCHRWKVAVTVKAEQIKSKQNEKQTDKQAIKQKSKQTDKQANKQTNPQS